jgi:ribosomal protein L19
LSVVSTHKEVDAKERSESSKACPLGKGTGGATQCRHHHSGDMQRKLVVAVGDEYVEQFTENIHRTRSEIGIIDAEEFDTVTEVLFVRNYIADTGVEVLERDHNGVVVQVDVVRVEQEELDTVYWFGKNSCQSAT